MRFSVYARLPEPVYDALLAVADQELLDPREQAAKFIVDGLRRAGALQEPASALTLPDPDPNCRASVS